MESSHGNSGSASKSNEPNGNTNFPEVKAIDVIMTPCGSCEGCNAIEDCGTKCENCIQNYIETAIENNANPLILTCLKRICHARNIELKRETVIVQYKSIKDEQEMKPDQIETKIETLTQEKENTVTMQAIKTELERKMKFNESVNMKKLSRSMEHGETGFNKSIKLNEASSEDNLAISENGSDDREASNVEMCGICLGCTTDCDNCWACIQRDVLSTEDLTPKMICENKKCLSVKEGIRDEAKKEDGNKVQLQRRKRCGTCPGCVVAQNCGNCAPCVRKRIATNEGTKFKGVCNARKCYKLKNTKSKRCEECEDCQSQSCGKYSLCVGSNKKLCPLKRCHWKINEFNSKTFQSTESNKIYGHGIKIKSKMSKPEKIIDQKKGKVDDYFDDFAFEDDHLSMANDSLIDINQLTQRSKLTKVAKWLDENIQLEENLDTEIKNESRNDFGTNRNKKSINSKSVKRIKKCGECSSCQAEDCGHCRTCQINDQFSDSLILGKVPCFNNVCKFPVELTGDMYAASLMSLQDDSSNGTVCPVKIVNGVLYDFRCFFCKKLPRAGSVNRSELMRHYSTVHYSQQLRKDYEIFMVDRHCLLCDVKLRTNTIPSHIGQKHNEIVKYLPPEAVALCPEIIQKEQMGGRRHQRAATVSSQASSDEVLDWPQVPKGFDPSSKDRNWEGNASNDAIMEIENNYEIVDGWIIENVTNSDEELPMSSDPALDYSGVGGRCSVCQKEFDEVTDAALHLHDNHDIKGGSSYLMKDCQNFIKSGFIQVSKVQNDVFPVTIQNKADDGYLDFEIKRKSLSTPLTNQITLGNDSLHRSSKDEEISAHYDEMRMDTSNSDGYLDFESKRYVARKSTSQKSPSSASMKEKITWGNSQHNSSSDEETSAQCDKIGMEFDVEVEDAMIIHLAPKNSLETGFDAFHL